MTSTLFKNGYVITMDPDRRLIENGAVYVEDRVIKDIGTTSKLTTKYNDVDRVVDASKHVVMPGLINTHNHLFQILLKSMGDDLNLIDWIHACILPHIYKIRPKDLYYAAATGSIELIKSGCTTNADMSYLVHNKLPDMCDNVVQASIDTGIRGYIVRTSENDDQFGLRSEAEKAVWLEHIETTDQMIRRSREYYKKWHGKGEGRIYPAAGPNWPPGSNKELLQAYSELSEETGLKFQYHIAETKWEFDNFKQKFGMTPTEWTYKNLPEMGKYLWGVHCIWLTEHDIDIFAKTKTGVSHNTTSNFYLSSGVAPIPKLLARGVPCSLGVDGAASNNTNNIWEMLKLTAFMHKVHNLEPTAITANDVLEMATIMGAETLGLQDEIGSLEPGKKA
ncbi:MAG: amidohydrolase family protein, partial [Candidatus Ranarchaeia archaeon]